VEGRSGRSLVTLFSRRGSSDRTMGQIGRSSASFTSDNSAPVERVKAGLISLRCLRRFHT
jgi:hypothetical protein